LLHKHSNYSFAHSDISPQVTWFNSKMWI
jgi:hypothetical protein